MRTRVEVTNEGTTIVMDEGKGEGVVMDDNRHDEYIIGNRDNLRK